jgi:hypothetical protein
MLVGAVDRKAKLHPNGHAGPALFDDLAVVGETPASDEEIGIVGVSLDPELDRLGSAGFLLGFDDGNHGSFPLGSARALESAI